MTFTKTAILIVVFAFSAAPLSADLVFDLRTGAGTAGSALDQNGDTGMFTDTGVTIQVSTSSTITGATGSQLNAISSGAGVDTTGVTSGGGDGASEMDVNEEAKFTFTFASPSQITLNEIDFVGFANGETVDVSVGASNFSLGFANLDSNQDWNADGGIAMFSGDMITISATSGAFRIGSIAFLEPVPEPASAISFGFLLGIVAATRRRRLA